MSGEESPSATISDENSATVQTSDENLTNVQIKDEDLHPVCGIFSNRLIFDNILEYLQFDDFKNLRLSCKAVNHKLLESRRHLFIFYISESSVKAGILFTAINSNNLKNFRLRGDKGLVNSSDQWNLLWMLLNTKAKFIDFTVSLTSSPTDYQSILKNDSFTLYPGTVNEENFKNLKTLWLHAEFLNAVKFSKCSKLVGNMFRHPKAMAIDGLPCPDPTPALSANLKFIAQRCTILTHLHIVMPSLDEPRKWNNDNMSSVSSLIQNNRNLGDLYIPHADLMESPHWVDLDLPNLKTFTAIGSEDVHSTLETFLKNHLLIEYLYVEFNIAFPLTVLDAILCPERSATLRKLVISSEILLLTETHERNNPWRNLKDLKTLTELGIEQMKTENSETPNLGLGFPVHVLCNLPENVERIVIQGMCGWKLPDTPLDFWSLSSVPLSNKTENLCFERCVLTHPGVQIILSTMTRLKCLEFRECGGLTNFSLTGDPTLFNEKKDSSHYADASIKNLKDLQKLKICDCYGITNEMLNHIQHYSLTELWISGNDEMLFDEETLASLLSRNLSLKELELNFVGDIQDENDDSESDCEGEFDEERICSCHRCKENRKGKWQKYIADKSNNSCILKWRD